MRDSTLSYFGSGIQKCVRRRHAEIDKRWVEILKHFKNEHFPYDNLVIFVEFTLCCPGTNEVEKDFSVGNDFWKSVTETSRNISARVIERDTSGEINYFLEDSRGFRTHQHGRQWRQNGRKPGLQK
ncbi:uncharacterized protein TNCV_3728311 [Trichonephila clavipes]|nr:uncharacterized protein TNCV_3728311 [Trichonephila clavipes]